MHITNMHFSYEPAKQLSEDLKLGIANAKGTTNSLVLKLDGEKLAFNGWSNFKDIVGTAHNAKMQAKHTTMLYRGEPGMLQRLCTGLPGFGALVDMALAKCPGMEVAFVHVLQQSSQQACFNWHTDTATQGYEKIRKTMGTCGVEHLPPSPEPPPPPGGLYTIYRPHQDPPCGSCVALRHV